MSQLFDDEIYYKEMKFFSIVTGKWPYQSKKQKYFFLFFLFSLTITEVIGEIMALVRFSDDKELVLESISPFIMTITAYSKYFSHVFNRKGIVYLLEKMKESWRIHSTLSEQKVLREYADIGKILIWIWIIGAAVATFSFTVEPLLPRVINFLLDNNETVPKRYPVPVYWYGIDMVGHYYYALSFSVLCIWIIIMVEITADTTFIVMTQHAVALFAITGHLLENIPSEKDYEKEQESKHDVSLDDLRYQHYVRCIKSHQRAIEFAEYLENTNVWGLGIILGLHIPIMSVTATQITTQAQNIQQTIKYILFGLIQIFHLLSLCIYSEQLITKSTFVQKSVINGLWYECNPKLQKLLTLVIMRSQRECKITAGKVVTISMETFTAIVKTAASYFTMLTQTRQS